MTTIPRRLLLAGLASVPLAAGWLKPGRHALAEPTLENVEIGTPRGASKSAVLAAPATAPGPAVVLVHGSGGLTDQYKDWAVQLANEGFVALALDDVGGTEEIAAWIEWLKGDPRSNGKVGVVGWDYGAEWALFVSMSTPVEATVVYVGLADVGAESLAHLKGPVLAHLGEQGTGLGLVEMFEREMKEAGRSLTIYWYPADDNFPFPEQRNYKKDLAEAAWARTVEFLGANLQ
jgi:carboxymethylenebutenolidase